jgi:DNA-binding FadR family transcriptional regulator
MSAKSESMRLYEQVSEAQAARVAVGEPRMGERLPSERDLALTSGVSRPTAREAVIALGPDRLVEVKSGSSIDVRGMWPTGGGAETGIGPFDLPRTRRALEGEPRARIAEQRQR